MSNDIQYTDLKEWIKLSFKINNTPSSHTNTLPLVRWLPAVFHVSASLTESYVASLLTVYTQPTETKKSLKSF